MSDRVAGREASWGGGVEVVMVWILEASAKGRKAETVSSFSWKDPVVVPNLIEENVQPWV